MVSRLVEDEFKTSENSAVFKNFQGSSGGFAQSLHMATELNKRCQAQNISGSRSKDLMRAVVFTCHICHGASVVRDLERDSS